MIFRFFVLLFNFLFPLSLGAQTQLTSIKAGHLFDSREGKWLENQYLVIHQGKVIAVTKTTSKNSKLIDLSSSWIVPGLIDAHTHLFLEDPTFGKNFAGGLLEFVQSHSQKQREELAKERAASLLHSGFTSVRDLGNSGLEKLEGFRKLPVRAFSSGPGVSSGHGQFPLQTSEVIVKKEYVSMETLPSGFSYDLVKLYADQDPNPEVADPEKFKAWVEWAHQHKLKVAAHATFQPTIEVAIQSSVDSIEHGDGATAGQLKMMAEKGMILVPTLVDVLFQKDMKKVCELVRSAKKTGVTVAFGSDHYFKLKGEFGQQTLAVLLAFRDCGLESKDVLQAATFHAARTLGKDNELGILEKGAFADFLVLEKDPVSDLSALQKPKMIFFNGEQIQP